MLFIVAVSGARLTGAGDLLLELVVNEGGNVLLLQIGGNLRRADSALAACCVIVVGAGEEVGVARLLCVDDLCDDLFCDWDLAGC